MLDDNGARLIDFGVAKNQTLLEQLSTSTAPGTVLFMAPEQWEGRATEQSDLYGAGLLLGCMLGRPITTPNQPPDIDDVDGVDPEWPSSIDARRR